MSLIDEILSATAHRPYDMPGSKWTYYQEWNNALFLHWKVPLEALRKLVPEQLIIDTFEDGAYISIVAFTMQQIRPRNLPAVKVISDFEEVNVRTYINNDGKKGVYFLNIEAAKKLSAYIAKALSGLPYEKSQMKRTGSQFQSVNKRKGFHLSANFDIQAIHSTKTALDKWLTERYCLYADINNDIYRYDIHHKEWELNKVMLEKLDLHYHFGNLEFGNRAPDLIHYSPGVKVVAWNKTKIS